MKEKFVRNIFYYKNYYLDFYATLSPEVRKKFNWTLQLISEIDRVPEEYGKRGTETREKYEEGFQAFKLGVMLQELRKEHGMTQEQLAEKCGTTKTYISRIENDASDIRLSTLMRIIREGFGRHLSLSVDI